MSSKPTHEQAQLHLQVYDLRREAKLRQGRDWFFKNYFVNNLEDWMKIAAPGTENGAMAGMVVSYWEQACALVDYGLLNEDLFFETSGEFFGVYERMKAVLPDARAKFVDPHFLEHLESVAKKFEAWSDKRSPGHVAAMREFMKIMAAQMSQGKAA